MRDHKAIAEQAFQNFQIITLNGDKWRKEATAQKDYKRMIELDRMEYNADYWSDMYLLHMSHYLANRVRSIIKGKTTDYGRNYPMGVAHEIETFLDFLELADTEQVSEVSETMLEQILEARTSELVAA